MGTAQLFVLDASAAGVFSLSRKFDNVNPVAAEPVASAPTDVSDEAVTPEASVVPVMPDAGTAVAVIVPVPEAPSEPPVPISSAFVFVAAVTPLNATLPAEPVVF